MFRYWSAFLLYRLVLAAGAGAHPLLLTVRGFMCTPSDVDSVLYTAYESNTR
jgi:hypothetical protein